MSATQHLLVIMDPVHLLKLLLSTLTGKVYDRQAEGEGEGCVNWNAAERSCLRDCACQALRVRSRCQQPGWESGLQCPEWGMHTMALLCPD